MPHVGVKRFATRDNQEDCAKHGKTCNAVVAEEVEAVSRIERTEHRWRTHDPDDAKRSDDDEPGDHDGTEQSSHAMSAVLLNHKQRDQNRDRDRHHIGPK